MNKPQTGQNAADTGTGEPPQRSSVQEDVCRMEEAAAASKCWPCGCLRNSLKMIEKALPPQARRGNLGTALKKSAALPDGSPDYCPPENLEPRPGCGCGTTCEEGQ